MAKTKRPIETTQHRIESFAEDLGKMLGHARSKAEDWLGQRKAIVKSLTDLRDEASKLLDQLGHRVAEVPFPRALGGSGIGKRGKGRPQGTGFGAAARKRPKMSAKGRAAISAAQKARWAKVKAAKRK
jgi:hypothetical protein